MGKTIKKHGMTTEKARRVKLRGHNKEYLFAELIGGKVVKGVNKIDVYDKNGRGYTVKGGSEVKGKSGTEGRWQLFMFGKRRFENDLNFPARELFIEILNSFPKTREEYDKNPEIYKKRVKIPMIKLKNYLSDKTKMHSFFDKAIFNFRLDFLVIYHNDIFHIFDREEILDIFGKYLKVTTNKTTQKVVFQYKEKLWIEIEVRKTEGKFPSILLITNKLKILKLLSDNIEKFEKRTRNIYTYGKTIDYFNDYFSADKK